MFKTWLRAYEVTLDLVLKYRFATLMVMIATLVGTVWLYIVVPKGFFPTEDTGFINVVTEGPSDISFKVMTERTRQIGDILLKDPAVDYINISTGGGVGVNATTNFGQIKVALKPREQREPLGVVIGRLRADANSLVGVAAYFQPVQNINIGGRIGKSSYQYTLQSSDTDTLYKIGPEMLEKIAKIPGLRDVTGDLYIKNPQVRMEIDREAAAVYGVTQDQIRQELFDCFGTRQVATIYTAINDYYVIVIRRFRRIPPASASCSSRRTSTDRPPAVPPPLQAPGPTARPPRQARWFLCPRWSGWSRVSGRCKSIIRANSLR